MLAAKLLSASGGVGGGSGPLYVDDVFSAYTYTGNGSTQTITNGIDLAGKGGMVWMKMRSPYAYGHELYDTVRGATKVLISNSTGAEATVATGLTAFSGSGFSLGARAEVNESAGNYVSWTFRKANNFYNHTTVVKSSGSNATVSFANLTTLGMVRVKRTDAAGSWYIWHRSLTAGKLLIGETTAAEATLGHITVSGTTVTLVNGVIADGTYLVEGFAHDTGTDGLIQCGSFTTNGSGAGSVTLGWEPQYVLYKNTDGAASDWQVMDSSRAMPVTSGSAARLYPNLSDAEGVGGGVMPNATGFTALTLASRTMIYLAIRRPNKPPTTGTQVYNAIARTGTGTKPWATGDCGFTPDMAIMSSRDAYVGSPYNKAVIDRLRNATEHIQMINTDAEGGGWGAGHILNMRGYDGKYAGDDSYWNANTRTYIDYFFKRAPGVLSQICYSGTGANKTESHDLGVAPELWLVKGRSGATQWVWGSSLLANTEKIVMPTPAGKVTDATAWNSTYPTATTLSLGTAAAVNTSAATYTAYLWATLAGVSKVFAYTGDGTSGKVINCGFTTGARFVMIVRTSAAGSVFIWDTARGIVAGNDPHLCLDTTAAEVTTDDSIDPDTSGFAINQVAATNINVNGATYIGLAYA